MLIVQRVGLKDSILRVRERAGCEAKASLGKAALLLASVTHLYFVFSLVAEHSTWIPIPLLGAVAIVLGVICITVIGVVVFTRKVTALVAHSNCGHPILTSLVLYVPFLPRERPRYDLPCTLCFFLSTCSLSSAFVYVLPHPSFRLGAPGRLDLHPICFAVTYSYSFLPVL
jgi:hypothetical protein